MKGIYVKLPNNGENRASIGHLLLPNKASSMRIGLHLIENWDIGPKGSHRNPQIIQAIAKTVGFFLPDY